MHEKTKDITELILKARDRAIKESPNKIDPELSNSSIKWPVDCIVGPGLEGAIACETQIAYVNGTSGTLIYHGYDIYELCAYSSYEEVSYLLLNGRMPTKTELDDFKMAMLNARHLPHTLRMMMSSPIEEMNPMSALRLGVEFMRQRLTWRDADVAKPSAATAIATDEDSIPMETQPMGEKNAIYEFRVKKVKAPKDIKKGEDGRGMDACIHLVSGMATIAAGIARIRADKLPIDPNPDLSHAANFLYMMTGEIPTAEEERIMDVALILHADHGMNASTFASMVVASTMSDIYFSIGSGIGALNGPLHGGANEEVVNMLDEINEKTRVKRWLKKRLKAKQLVPGFGHRVYKAHDPRSRILKPLAKHLVKKNPEFKNKYQIARELEKEVVSTLGKEKKIFPNVDFYSGIVYGAMDIPTEMFTSIFAVSRVLGWTARVHEYLKKNRIFRPRAMYVGKFNKKYKAIANRRKKK